jgi:acyl-CoA synthetase (AMP-forming)/AMP-acid ligase II
MSAAPKNLSWILERRAAATPEKAALLLPARGGSHDVVTYAGLLDDVRRLAGAFRALGLREGDAVMVMVPMSRPLYVLALALFRIGAPLVFIDPWVGLDRLDRAIALVRPKAFVGAAIAHALRFFSPAFRRVPIKIAAGRFGRLFAPLALERLVASGDARAGEEIAPVGPDAPALLTFTTGSTGEPKGAVRTHAFLDAQRRALTAALGTREDDVDLAALPIFVLNNLACGATSVVPDFDPRRPGTVEPGRVLAQIESCGVTTAAASPAFFRPIVRRSLALGKTLPGVRAVFTGGAPVAPDLLEEARRVFPNARVAVVYGSTEAEPISMIDAEEVLGETAEATRAGRGNCVGRPVGEIEVAVVEIRDGPLDGVAPLPPGRTGEIVVAGDHVNRAYFKNERAFSETKIRAPDGRIWHRTGDVGRLDERGRIWLLGRVNAGLVREGRTWWPLEVEPVVERCPAVERAALIALSGGRAGIVVVPRGGRRCAAAIDLEVRAHCKERGIPCDRVFVARALPFDPRHNAKIDHAALRARYAS